MLTPQLKPTIDIDMFCFIRSGVFDICIKAPWYFSNMPLEVVAELYAFRWEVVAHSSGSCSTPGELWYVVHHI